jgi:hypothetical protein
VGCEVVQGSCTGVTTHDVVVAEPGTVQYGSVDSESPVAHVVTATSTSGATCGAGVGVGAGVDGCGVEVGIAVCDGAGASLAEGQGVRSGVGLRVARRVADDDEDGDALGARISAIGLEIAVSEPDGTAVPLIAAIGFGDPGRPIGAVPVGWDEPESEQDATASATPRTTQSNTRPRSLRQWNALIAETRFGVATQLGPPRGTESCSSSSMVGSSITPDERNR